MSMARPKVHAIDIFFHPPDSFSRQQMTTITTFNGDTVAKGRVVLVVIVVVNPIFLSLILNIVVNFILRHTEITEITESAFGTGCAQEAKRKFL